MAAYDIPNQPANQQIPTPPSEPMVEIQQPPQPPIFESEPTPTSLPPPPPPPKRGLSKILLIIPVLLLAVLGFVVFRFISSRGTQLTGGREITWWGLWEDESVVGPLISEYQEKNPEIKINFLKQSPQDYRERLINSLARGEGPDIFRFHNTWVPMMRPELDPVPADIMSAAEFAQTFYPVAVSDLTSGTGLMGVPLEYDGIALFINEEIFERAAKAPPTTWDDLRQLAIELTIKDEKGIIQQSGIALGRTENVDHWPEILSLMMLQNGVKMSDPTGKLAEDALTFFTLFASVDRVWNESLPPSTVAFSSGKLAMYFGPSWRVHEIKQQNPNLRFRVLPVPQIPREDPNEPGVAYATYWVEGVWSRSKSKKAAWDFLKFLSTKESLQKLYQNASQTRLFGELYPRVDMAELLISDPTVGAFISQASYSQSWYLASRTFDGPTGINSQINKYFEDAVNTVAGGRTATEALTTAATGVNEVLSRYGLVAPVAK